MDLRELLLILHIVSALIAAAGLGAAIIGMLAAGRTPDVATVARTARVQTLGGRAAAWSMVAAAVFGTWLVIETDWIAFGDAWIGAAYALWIVAMGVGGGIVDRHARRLRELAAAIERGERTSAEVQAAWEAPLARVGNIALVVALVLFVYLMVAKPGA